MCTASRYAIERRRNFTPLAHRCGQRGDSRLAEQDADIDAESGIAQALDQTDRQQRMPAQFKEVVVTADFFQAKHVRPEIRHEGLRFTHRCLVGLTGQRFQRRVRQGTAIKLAMAGQRQRVQTCEGQRHHVRGKTCTQRLAQRFGFDGSVFGEPGQQTFTAHQHHGILHLGLTGQGRLDFAQLDTHAANFYLVVIASQVVQAAIVIPAHQIAAAIQARLRRGAERVGDKTLFGHLRTIQIPAGNPRATDIQLADDTHRHWLQLLVQYVYAGVGDRAADMQRPAWLHGSKGRYHGGFSRTIVVDHREARVAVELTQAVAADQQRAQRRVLARASEGLFGHRGRQETDLKWLLQPPVEQFIDVLVADLGRWQVQYRTGTQRRPHFPGHCVEAETGHARCMTAGLQSERLTMPMHQIDQRAVFDHDAFGLAGGAGGVNDVRQFLRIKARNTGVIAGGAKPVRLLDVHPGSIGGKLVGRVFSQNHTGRAVLQQIGNTLRRIDRVYRHVGRTGLEHRQHGNQTFGTTVQAQGNAFIGFDAQANQMMGQAIGALVELSIGQDIATLNHRRAVRLACGLRFDQRIDGAVLWERLFTAIEIEQQMVAFCRVENRNVFQPQWQRLFQGFQQMRQRVEHPASDTLGSHTLLREHMQVEAFAQIVHAEGQRIVAAYITAEHPHALPEPFAVQRFYIGTVAIIEQGTEQRRPRSHRTAALSEYQRSLLVSDQRRQLRMDRLDCRTGLQRRIHTQRQGIDKYAECPISTLTAHASQQHSAEHHVATIG